MVTRRAIRILATVCLAIAVLSGAIHAQAKKEEDDARSARQLVQRFYDWYASFEREMFEPGAVKGSRLDSLNAKEAKAALAPRLLQALAEDYSAQGRVSGYIVGLDFDPFLATNGPTCDRYEATSVEKKGPHFWVGMRGAGNCSSGGPPVVFAEVAQEDSRWQVVNLHYPGEPETDLVSILKRLRDSRKKPTEKNREQSPALAGTWRTVESVEWRYRGAALAAIVEETENPGTARLRIASAGQPDYVVSVEGGLVPLRDSLLDPQLRSLNSVSASYVFLPRNLRTVDGVPVLIVTGWAFASDPGSFRALALDQKGRPYEVFASDTFDLAALADVDGDGLTEMVGYRRLSQEWGPTPTCTKGLGRFLTYNPYAVYHLPRPVAGTATYSLELSRRYNLAHYYGWVGPEASEDWTVVLCAPVKPRIMKRADAERLYGK